jgi:hypothetical protein
MFLHFEPQTGSSAVGTAFGSDDAVGFQLLATEGVCAFEIELSVSQDAADRCLLMGPGNQLRQRGAVVSRRLPYLLGRNQLPFEVDCGLPLQLVFPTASGLVEVLGPADKVAAQCALRQTRSIDAYRGRTSPPPPRHPQLSAPLGCGTAVCLAYEGSAE